MTENQKKLLLFISSYRLKFGYSPTLKEMVKGIGVFDNKSLLGIINSLVGQEYLKREKQKSRSILLTDKAFNLLGVPVLPLEYQSKPLFHDQLCQPADLTKNGATIFSSASEFLNNEGNSVESDGTSLTAEQLAVVETVAAMIISNSSSNNAWISLIASLLSKTEMLEIFSWLIAFAGSVWLYTQIVGSNLIAFGYSIITVLVISKYLIKQK